MPYPCGMSHKLNGNGNDTGPAQARLQPPPVKPPSAPVKEYSVSFRTADGIQRHGVIVRVMPHTAHFEVHDPTLILKRCRKRCRIFKLSFGATALQRPGGGLRRGRIGF